VYILGILGTYITTNKIFQLSHHPLFAFTMFDAIGVLGLAANIVQFVDFTGRLISKGKQIYGSI